MTLSTPAVKIEVRLFDILTGAVLEEKFMALHNLAANRTTELAAGLSVHKTTAIQTRMLDPDGIVIARASDWPQPLKYVMLPSAAAQGITLTVTDGAVEIRSKTPCKGVELYMADEARDVWWEDNGVDIFPGDIYVVKAPGVVKSDDVRMRYYGLGHERGLAK